MKKIFSDKEKIMSIINNMDKGTFEEIVFSYLRIYHKDFSPERLIEIINRLNQEFLYPQVCELEHTRRVAKEHATYLKTYLEGDMYTTKEAAIKNLPCQVKNAQRIIDICNGKLDIFGD